MAETREHNFDGIEEYDNPLPRWWVQGFLLSILFALVYCILFPSTWFWDGLLGWSSQKRYEAQVASAPQVRASPGAALTVDLSDPALVAAGKGIFAVRCAVCHGPRGEGKIGPSLVSGPWKYGGKPADVLATISGGRPGGMPPWGKVLSSQEIQQVAAYVLVLGKGKTSGAAARPGGS